MAYRYRLLQKFRKLSDRQIKFCEAYLKNGRQKRKAALEAGYDENNASQAAKRNLKSPYVKDYLQDRLKRMEKEYGTDFDYKVNKLKKVVDITIPDDAQDKKELDARSGVMAISELNKMQGHYSADKLVTATADVTNDKAFIAVKEAMLADVAKKQEEY